MTDEPKAGDDLILRLRTWYSHRGDGLPTQPVNRDGEEAADRIERLEAALERIRDRDVRRTSFTDVVVEMRQIARAALGDREREGA